MLHDNAMEDLNNLGNNQYAPWTKSQDYQTHIDSMADLGSVHTSTSLLPPGTGSSNSSQGASIISGLRSRSQDRHQYAGTKNGGTWSRILGTLLPSNRDNKRR